MALCNVVERVENVGLILLRQTGSFNELERGRDAVGVGFRKQDLHPRNMLLVAAESRHRTETTVGVSLKQASLKVEYYCSR